MNLKVVTFVITLITEMKERILEFLRAENKSSAQFAEEIGVQPSGISHILSGRNNPSLDFIMKMLDKYHDLSIEWLLFGKGKMYKNPPMQSLFDESNTSSGGYADRLAVQNSLKPPLVQREIKSERQSPSYSSPGNEKSPAVVKIVWFYDDRSFEEYYPGQ